MLTSELASAVMRQHATALVDHAFEARLEQDAEHIHQARVATRRLRAALRIFKDFFHPEADSLSEQLRWIAGYLGAARDLDVQIRRLQAHAAELGIDEEVAPFCTWLEGRREHELASLDEALQSSRFARLVTDVQTTHTIPQEAVNTPRVEEFAPAQLKRAWKRLRKVADELTRASPASDFHQVRIRAKRLRYTTEFFEPVYGRPARRVIQSATDLQDLLGDLQDGVVLTHHVHSAIQSAATAWPAETSLALGQVVQSEAQHALDIRRGFSKVYARVERAWGKLGKSL